MSPLRDLISWLLDEQFRFATLVGLLSIPVTVALSWETVAIDGSGVGGTVSGMPLIVAGLLVGYYYSDRPVESSQAGKHAGVLGSIGVVIVFVASGVTAFTSTSSDFTVFLLLATPIITLIGAGFSVLVVLVSAIVGDRIRDMRTWDAKRQETEAAEPDWEAVESRWWKFVAVYVLVTPLVLVFVLVWGSSSDTGIVAAVILLFGLVIATALTLLSLYKDAKQLHEAGSPWIPRVELYLGIPLGAYVLVYVVRTVQDSINPAGDGMYGFLVVLWAVAVVYLISRHRSIGTR